MRFTRLLLINFIVFFLAFMVVEISFRILNPNYTYYEQTYSNKFEASTEIKPINSSWVKTDDELGWVCKQGPHLEFYLEAYSRVHYQINKEGFRNKISFDSIPVPKTKERILLIGDSFLFGIFLEDKYTVANQLQNRVGGEFEVYNLAVPAWGLDQMHLAYQKYVEQINPDQVILMCIDDDIARLIESFYWGVGTKPAFKLEQGLLKQKEGNDGKLNLLESYFYFQSKAINSLYQQYCLAESTPLAAYFFDRFIKEALKSGRQFSVIRCPRIAQVKSKSKTVPFNYEAYFSNKDCNYIDLTEELNILPPAVCQSMYISGDGHPSNRGASLIKDCIYNNFIDALK